MRSARIGLLGLGLLLATLPATALADKDNTPRIAVRGFVFTCDTSDGTFTYSFSLRNNGDADGTVAARLEVRTTDTLGTPARDKHNIDLGPVLLAERGGEQAFGPTSVAVGYGPAIAKATLFVHEAHQKKIKKEKSRERERIVCTP